MKVRAFFLSLVPTFAFAANAESIAILVLPSVTSRTLADCFVFLLLKDRWSKRAFDLKHHPIAPDPINSILNENRGSVNSRFRHLLSALIAV
jgi:hypothetical protein